MCPASVAANPKSSKKYGQLRLAVLFAVSRDNFFSDFLGRNQRPRRGRSAYARFLPDEKSGKESPKAGPSPALWNPPRGTGCPCVLLVSALGLVGSHGWRGNSTESTYFSGRQCFYSQGLTLVSRCSQRPEARLPAAGTPLLQDRPGCGNHQAVGPAARLAWCAGSGRSHSKSDGPTIDLTQFQPRTPGRFLGGNALSGFSSILATQNGPQRSVPGWGAGLLLRNRRSTSFFTKRRRPKPTEIFPSVRLGGLQSRQGYGILLS